MKALAMSPGKAGVVVGGFLLASVLMLYADRRMSTVFSQFWHSHHARLREALKEAAGLHATWRLEKIRR
ncbi:MAG: hypothetical protein P0120_21505 [Nitrospira sp.]|nr:hypothetical protein [Nitrospira sp.]